MQEIIIQKNEAGQRLDKLLAKYLNEAPKSFLYKMMRKKNIVLNGKKATGDEKLVIGDSIKLFLADETIEKFSSVNIQRTTKQLDILYEDADVLLINKPAGMLAQKAKPSDESVVEHIISYLLNSKQLEEAQLKSFRPSICNRLDRNTSGLITAGKSLQGLQGLSQYFKERTMGKYYITLVAGEVTQGEHIAGYLYKDCKTNKVTIASKQTGDASRQDYIETAYRPLWSTEELSMLEVHLITGKTHQIRAHLAHVGHPIIGDVKYGSTKYNARYEKQYGVKHQLLHAYRMEFPEQEDALTSLHGKQFVAPLPKIYRTICVEKKGKYGDLEFQRS